MPPGTKLANVVATVRAGQPSKPSWQDIQTRAYWIYLARASKPGDEVQDWLTAERELSVPPIAATR